MIVPSVRCLRAAGNSWAGRRWYAVASLDAVPANKKRFVPTKGSFPLGFRAGASIVGVKPSNKTKPDLALITSSATCTAAAMFTKNKFQAAPVTYSRALLRDHGHQGIHSVIINSGCANAVTGKGGLEDAQSMAQTTDQATQGQPQRQGTLVMSTGVIGQRLPIQKITQKIPETVEKAGSSLDDWLSAALAICTTDTFPKLRSTSFRLPSQPDIEYRLAGLTKGAGMIHPNLATLLGVMATDVPISANVISALLRDTVNQSYNSITIDGDTSTNDTIALLANGAAGGTEIDRMDSPDYLALRSILIDFAADLAKLIVRDGEGATKFVTVHVQGAPQELVARRVASTIARSPLVKTALYGKDANWGRIACATGYALVSEPGTPETEVPEIVPDHISVSFLPADGSEPLKLLVKGEPEVVDESRAAEILQEEDLQIVVDLGMGQESSTYWTCDYSHEYITINGDYRT